MTQWELEQAILDMQHQMEEQEGNIRSSLEAEFQERGRMLAQDHSVFKKCECESLTDK
jgi:hypothetical protein